MPPEMSNQEAIEMMQRCIAEIGQLRGAIARLQPKADAYDNICTILRLLPQPGVGMGEDLVWRLDKRIQELQAQPAKPEPEVDPAPKPGDYKIVDPLP